MTPRVAVYSAIYGSYEATAKRLPPDLPCPAFMFTDRADLPGQAMKAGWSVVESRAPYSKFTPNPANGDPEIVRPMLAHKFWKTHPAEAMAVVGCDADITIWLDGSMEIKVGGQEFVDRCLAALGDDDWSVMRHPWRACLFEEAVYSSTLIFRYDPAAMMRQHDHYLEAGHPRDWGLFATGHMVRRQNELVEIAGEEWWDENLTWSHQDQISLPWIFQEFGTDQALKWNADLPWGELWHLRAHGE